jgi:hypothetical protein
MVQTVHNKGTEGIMVSEGSDVGGRFGVHMIDSHRRPVRHRPSERASSIKKTWAVVFNAPGVIAGFSSENAVILPSSSLSGHLERPPLITCRLQVHFSPRFRKAATTAEAARRRIAFITIVRIAVADAHNIAEMRAIRAIILGLTMLFPTMFLRQSGR